MNKLLWSYKPVLGTNSALLSEVYCNSTERGNLETNYKTCALFCMLIPSMLFHVTAISQLADISVNPDFKVKVQGLFWSVQQDSTLVNDTGSFPTVKFFGYTLWSAKNRHWLQISDKSHQTLSWWNKINQKYFSLNRTEIMFKAQKHTWNHIYY